MKRSRLTLLAAVLFAGCEDAAPGTPSQLTRRDSAGIEIVEIPSELLESLPLWRLTPEPTLVLGASDGDGADVFGSISSVVALPGGRLAVVDGRSNQIKIFDESGGHLRTIGRSGDGPGEFAQTPIVTPDQDGGIVAYDWRSSRITVFDSLGVVLRTVRLNPASCSYTPLGNRTPLPCLPRGVLSNGAALVMRDERPSPSPDLVGQDFGDLGTTLGLVSENGYAELERVPLAPVHVRSARGENGVERVALVSPILAPSALGVAGIDHVAIARDDRYTIHLYNDAGSLIRIVRVLREPQPITSAEAEMLLAFDPPLTELPGEAGVAETRPVMHLSARFGDGDDMWIPDFRYGPLTGTDQPSHTTIFGIDGSPVARVEIPPNPLYRGQRAGSDAGSSRDRYRVVSRDSLGVQRLLVFAIEKGP